MATLETVVTCPACGNARTETMPLDRCVFFWECPACRVVSRPKAGDCCVYCSYGDRRCPPVQDDSPCPPR
ncbi:MAG: GDCCVxC domain-containing (seleno)protein [Vicinamibacterales bacterium]